LQLILFQINEQNQLTMKLAKHKSHSK